MPNLETVFAFSGQGSQYFQMGLELHTRDFFFRRLMGRMDELVRDLSGHSVLDVIYDTSRTKAEAFDHLPLTHPAIFMVEWATAQLLIQRGVVPSMVRGVSLGTMTAAAVAGCMSWEQALTLIVRQAQVVEDHAVRGGMIAVLADPGVLGDDELHGRCELAARNFKNHFVVSAPHRELGLIEACLRRHEATFQRLPVRFPFHSSWFDCVRPRLHAVAGPTTSLAAQMPLACCATVDVLTLLPPDHFWSVARLPIQFAALVAKLETQSSYRYIDVGPAGTLATFLRHALPATSQSQVFPTLTPFGRDIRNLERVCAD